MQTLNLKGQHVQGNYVAIMHRIRGDSRVRFAKIGLQNPYFIPVELLPLAAGKDAWMRDISVKCSGCRTPHRAGDMQAGYQDIACQTCIDKAELENAELDGE
jgi:hypothetical protein